mgnify:CR=1 FL=1
MSGGPDNKEDELAGTEQPFVSHLIELRDRLIRVVIALGLVFGLISDLTYTFVDPRIDFESREV